MEMIEKVNKEFTKLKTFNQLKIAKLGPINKIIDNNTKVFNKLFKDLDRMANPVDLAIYVDFFNKDNLNKTNIKINKVKKKSMENKKKEKIIPKKSIKYNLSFNLKKSAPITSTDNSNRNQFSFITSPVQIKPINYQKLNPFNIKKSNFYMNQKNKEKLLFEKKLNRSYKINYETEQSGVNHYNSFNNNKNEDSFQRTFITHQKNDSKIKRNNFFNESTFNISNNKTFKTQQSFHKQFSSDILRNYINDSSNIYNKHYIKFLEEEKSISSTINYIKNMINENEKYKSYEKQINYLIKEDLDIPKIRKNMKMFKRSLKGRITFKTNDLFKTSMITKKIADIINCYDTFSKMNDIYFYKNKNIFDKIYPPLSFRATHDDFDKNYEQMYYYIALRNKIKKKPNNINRIKV